MVNLGTLTPEITRLMFTHLGSTVHLLRMLMHLITGHVTLLSVGLRVPGGLMLGFASNFLLKFGLRPEFSI